MFPSVKVIQCDSFMILSQEYTLHGRLVWEARVSEEKELQLNLPC